MSSPPSRRIAFAIVLTFIFISVAQPGVVDADGVAYRATMPGPRSDPITFFTGSEVVIIGGTDIGSFVPVLHYAPGTFAITPQAANFSPYKSADFTGAWTGSKAYIFGGQPNWSTIFSYDPATGTASLMNATMPVPITGAFTFAHGGDVYIIGGRNLLYPWNDYDTVYRYDPETDSITLLNATLPYATSGSHNQVAYDGKYAYLIGSGARLRYEPEVGTFTTIPVACECFTGWQSTQVVGWDGQFTYIFGVLVGNQTNAIMRLDPVTGDWIFMSSTALVAGAGATEWFNEVILVNLPGPTPDTKYIRNFHLLPGAPQSISATVVPTAINVTWTPPASNTYSRPIHHYIIRVDNGPYVHLPPGVMYYCDCVVAAGATVRYEVRAQNADGWGAPAVIIRTAIDVPSPPTLNSMAGPGWFAVLHTWEPPANNSGAPITAYRLNSNGIVRNLGTNASEFYETGLPVGPRNFTLTAVSEVGESAPSNVESVTVYGPALPPSQFIVDAGPGSGEVTLEWDAPIHTGIPPYGGPGVDYFEITRTTPWGTKNVGISPEARYFLDTGLPPDTKVSYAIRSWNPGGPGNATFASATTFAAPGAPTDLFADVDASDVFLTWQKPELIDHQPRIQQFNVYRSDSASTRGTRIGSVSMNEEEESIPVQFTHEDAPAGRAFYSVSAVNLVGEGPRSPSVDVIVAPSVGAIPTDTYKSCTERLASGEWICTRGSSDVVTAVAAGRYHTCVLLAKGNVDCWGDNAYGQSEDRLLGDAIAITAGDTHTCARLTLGRVACWGDDAYGKSTGLANEAFAVTAGTHHTCAGISNRIVCKGNNAFDSAPLSRFTPDLRRIDADWYDTCYTTTSVLACLGSGPLGGFSRELPSGSFAVAVGHGFVCHTSTTGLACDGASPPGAASMTGPGTFTGLAAGGDHVCVTTEVGRARCSSLDLSAVQDAVSVSVGYEHACVVREGGTVTCANRLTRLDDYGQATAYPGVIPTQEVST